jgi:hypothetical protein
MKKYTFIAEYRGGTYISQYVALSIENALIEWVNNLDSKYFSHHKKKLLKKEIADVDSFPLPIDGVDKVWCVCYLSGKYFLLLNIIETA